MLINQWKLKYNNAILKIILKYEKKITINFSISYNNAEKRFYRIIYTRMAAGWKNIEDTDKLYFL